MRRGGLGLTLTLTLTLSLAGYSPSTAQDLFGFLPKLGRQICKGACRIRSLCAAVRMFLGTKELNLLPATSARLPCL